MYLHDYLGHSPCWTVAGVIAAEGTLYMIFDLPRSMGTSIDAVQHVVEGNLERNPVPRRTDLLADSTQCKNFGMASRG